MDKDDDLTMTIVNDSLKPDLCRNCTHMNTCRYYDKLTDAINPVPQLTTSFDVLLTAGIAIEDAYISPFSEKVIMRNMGGSPIVGIIHCNKFAARKVADENQS